MKFAVSNLNKRPQEKPKILSKINFSDTKWKTPFKFFLLCTLSPPLLILIYTVMFASEMYISESKFALRGTDSNALPDIATTLLKTSSSTTSDSYILYQYIKSYDLISTLNIKFNIIEHYSNRNNDFLSRLNSQPTQQDLIDYWQNIMNVSFDPDTGIITVKIRAYTPTLAKSLNNEILLSSERLVNEMNQRSKLDAVFQSQEEVKRAEMRLKQARLELKKYRDKSTTIDPSAAIASIQTTITTLENSSAASEAELAQALTFMRKNTPQIVTLQSKLNSLKSQLNIEKRKLANLTSTSSTLSTIVTEFENLKLEEDFAQQQYTTALASMETARVQNNFKSKYIIPFQQPNIPDESLYPKPFLATIITLFVSLTGFGLCTLIYAAIREHAGF